MPSVTGGGRRCCRSTHRRGQGPNRAETSPMLRARAKSTRCLDVGPCRIARMNSETVAGKGQIRSISSALAQAIDQASERSRISRSSASRLAGVSVLESARPAIGRATSKITAAALTRAAPGRQCREGDGHRRGSGHQPQVPVGAHEAAGRTASGGLAQNGRNGPLHRQGDSGASSAGCTELTRWLRRRRPNPSA